MSVDPVQVAPECHPLGFPGEHRGVVYSEVAWAMPGHHQLPLAITLERELIKAHFVSNEENTVATHTLVLVG